MIWALGVFVCPVERLGPLMDFGQFQPLVSSL